MAKKFHSELSSENLLTSVSDTDNISAHDYVAHPINAFHLMKRMSVEWREVLRDRESEVAAKDLIRKLPVERDFVYGAHFGLMAAQNYYDQGTTKP